MQVQCRKCSAGGAVQGVQEVQVCRCALYKCAGAVQVCRWADGHQMGRWAEVQRRCRGAVEQRRHRSREGAQVQIQFRFSSGGAEDQRMRGSEVVQGCCRCCMHPAEVER